MSLIEKLKQQSAQIEILKDEKDELNHRIWEKQNTQSQILIEFMTNEFEHDPDYDMDPDDFKRFVLGHSWECPTSPVGACVYEEMDDPCHDHCFFCHDPEERK